MCDGEWEQFMETLRQSLPATFRITGTTNKYMFNIMMIGVLLYSKSPTVMLIV